MSTDRYATFQSSYFDSTTPNAHFINPNCFGEDLAKWLRDGLAARFEPGGIIQEDYGWGFWTNVNSDPYWVSVQPWCTMSSGGRSRRSARPRPIRFD
jgi:hypothetical protein